MLCNRQYYMENHMDAMRKHNNMIVLMGFGYLVLPLAILLTYVNLSLNPHGEYPQENSDAIQFMRILPSRALS
jgi:hypothetical protein